MAHLSHNSTGSSIFFGAKAQETCLVLKDSCVSNSIHVGGDEFFDILFQHSQQG